MNRGDPSTQVQVDARLLWRAVLADLQQSVPPAAFEWLRNTRLSDLRRTWRRWKSVIA